MLHDLFNLKGKTALITGGSKGLGLQIAEAVCEFGGNVIIIARNEDDLKLATQNLKKISDKVEYIAADINDESQIESLVEKCGKIFGSIDILVNNAGKSWAQKAEDYSMEKWHEIMSLNSDIPFMLSKIIAKKYFIPNNYGKILNIASIGGLKGNRPDLGFNFVSYNASKGAIISMTRALASEWGKYNINVNALCPGFFPSELSAEAMEKSAHVLIPAIPIARYGGPEDLKGPALLLISEAGRHITGETLVVDGGMISA